MMLKDLFNDDHLKVEDGVPVRSFLTKANLKRLYQYAKPHKGKIIIALIAAGISGAMQAAWPWVVGYLLKEITVGGGFTILNYCAIGLIVLFLVESVLGFTEEFLLDYSGERIVLTIRTSLYRHLHGLSFDFFSKQRVGDMVSRLSNDVYNLQSVMTHDIAGTLQGIAMLATSVVVMFTMNPMFTCYILLITPFLVITTQYFSGKIERGSVRVQDQMAQATVIAEESLQAVRVVKSFGRERHEVSRYVDAMERTFQSSLRISILENIFSFAMGFIGMLAITSIVYVGGREVILGRMGLPEITTFLIYGATLTDTLDGFAGLYSGWSAAFGGIKRVFNLMDLQPTIQDAPDACQLQECNGRITLEDVSFTYDGQTPVIQNLSLDIKSGEILALVGPSGAGKSTLFNLIPRFYDPNQGRITIDGQDLRTLTQDSLRSHMAIVPQETILFGGTIRDNLLYGRLEATEEEMIAAAKSANAHDFIMEFPNKYESQVGERGVNLSGGQRQRIAIARAILRNPKILLLDEATSALDNESEELVQDALNHLMQNDRTTIIIAHRLSTIKVAHRIAVLDAGRLAELGTHEELMAMNALYARLYNMQFRTPEEILK